jgi:hypothetical protein
MPTSIPSITLIAAATGVELSRALYIAGFISQVVGGLIVIAGIIDDSRAAKRLPTGVTFDWIDKVPEVLRSRVLARRGWRIVGVLLVFVGAGVGLAANLLALSAGA